MSSLEHEYQTEIKYGKEFEKQMRFVKRIIHNLVIKKMVFLI